MRKPTTEQILVLIQDYVEDIQDSPDRPDGDDTPESIAIDSLDQVELIIAIEEEFDQLIPDDFFTVDDRNKTLRELSARIAKLLGSE